MGCGSPPTRGRVCKGKGKAVPYSLKECRRGAHLPPLSHWARRYINHWRLWRMRPTTVTFPAIALWPVPIYTACWQIHVCEQLVTWKRNGRESNRDPLSRESNVLTITLHYRERKIAGTVASQHPRINIYGSSMLHAWPTILSCVNSSDLHQSDESHLSKMGWSRPPQSVPWRLL